MPTTSVSAIVVQQLISPNTATPGNINFAGIAFDPSGNIYMGTNNDLYLLQNDYSLSHLASFSTGGICGDLTSCNYPFSILAVTFQTITAVAQNDQSVSVSWTVSEQENIKGYYIERSVDGSNWSELSFVASNQITGINDNYNFIDNSPNNGINYYRIHEVDMDGSGSYSVVKTVSIQNTGNASIQVWPNPAKDAIKIQNNDNLIIARIYNQSGSLIIESKLTAGANSINVNALPFGAYIVNMKDNNGKDYNQKFIKE